MRPAQRVAELQASRLLAYGQIDEAPVPEELIAGLPRIDVQTVLGLDDSGSSRWQHGAWRIRLNADEAWQRRRFTLAHELKHVLDAGMADTCYRRLINRRDELVVEQICDQFAGCLLMPKRLIYRAWGERLQAP